MYNYIVMSMKLRLKRKYKYVLLLLIFIICIVIINICVLKNDSLENLLDSKENTVVDNEPVYKDHYHEFNITYANYIEKYYERYLNYKKEHSEYNDDLIITYVNIGLDNPFYTNMEDTDMNDGILILCNKYHKLKSNYVPDLVSLSGYGGGQMAKVAAPHYKEMIDAAKAEGIKLFNVSGYRSYSTQQSLYNRYVKRDGQEKADTYSARAGSSEHQTGLASDINTASSSAHFENTKEYAWLINNSYKYGFILRYPKDKTFITGYKYEPWHYRYVGIDVAKIIYEKDITYEEYYATYILKG